MHELGQMSAALLIPPSGAFLINSEGVKYGIFENLKVFLKKSIQLSRVKDWNVGIDKRKYGAMGEDLFVARLRGLVMRKRTRTGTLTVAQSTPLQFTLSRELRSTSNASLGTEVFSKTAFSILT